jgi:hypothetical protein
MTTRKRPSIARTPLTTEELERLTSDDFVRLKLTDDEKSRLRAINKAREQERNERSARLRLEEEPILADLRSVGWNVESVWDLVNTSTKYPEAVPILLKHLLLPYSDRTRAGIARALAVPDAKDAWPTLVAEYRKAPTGTGIIASGETKEFNLGAKDGLACAVAASATASMIEELIVLAKDRSLGSSRLLLLRKLRRSKNPSAKKALDELASDPDLTKEIASWKRL